MAFRVLCQSDEGQPAIDLFAAGAQGILGCAEKERIEFVAETWRPSVWNRQG
jgi:hypothetical protein